MTSPDDESNKQLARSPRSSIDQGRRSARVSIDETRAPSRRTSLDVRQVKPGGPVDILSKVSAEGWR